MYPAHAGLPKVEHRSITTRREKLVKIGARIAYDGRYLVRVAEVALPRALFAEILNQVARLRLSHLT